MKIQNIVMPVIILMLVSSCAKTEAPKTTILCGTSMIASMVRDIAPDADIATLVPPLVCPGNFDMKPGDAKKAAAAKVLIIHPFQQYLVEKIRKINRDIAVEIVGPGNLNTPGEYLTAEKKAETVLLKYMPGKQSEFAENQKGLAQYLAESTGRDDNFRKNTAGKKIKVFCSFFQADTAAYAGFEIAGTFGSPDAMTPARLSEMAAIAKKQGVKYIISNLTGDHDMTADIINKQVKAKKIILSSFPLEEGKESWYLNLYNFNMDAIKTALGEK